MSLATGACAAAPHAEERMAGIRGREGRSPRPRVLVLTVGFTIGGAEQLDGGLPQGLGPVG
jgi:hypothetical protein